MGTAKRSATLTQASAVEEVVEQIRELIVSGGLSVGDKLPTERELCDRFSTSRNTVREAMRILKAYGVVDVRPKVGATIVDNRLRRAFDLFSLNMIDVSRETFSDVQGFRELIEVGACERIFERAGPAEIAALREVNDGLRASRSMQDAVQIDFRFHVEVVGLIGNQAVLEVYQIMKPVVLRIMETGKTVDSYRRRVWKEHEAVIGALEARDRVAYQYQMKTHLGAGRPHFRSRPGGEPDAETMEARA